MSAPSSPQVSTRSGVVAGLARGEVELFRGIRYARPLLPGRRVAAPEPAGPWQGVLDATRWAPAAPQEDIAVMGVGATGEDCLALNIWRPARRPGPLPVMVWIHGGGFATGASHQALYEASALARDNGVIVVSLNYRLGILGFGYWEGLGLPGATTNAGLRDQLLALEWVRDHIADFGGDPGNVTLFGESAGGMSIACLLAAPRARGLFHRAIIQSGSADHVVAPAEAARITRRFADAAGDAAACLEGDLAGIVRAQRACFSTTVNRGRHEQPVPQFGMTLMPVFGDDILPAHPLLALAEGASADLPVLLGTTVDEWTLFYLTPQAMGRGDARPEPDEARLRHEFERVLPGRGEALLPAYRALLPDATPGSEVFCAYETDRMFRIPTVRLAEARFAAPAPTWHYLFDWPCAWNRRLKACHVMEVPFVFGITDQPTGQFFTGGGEGAAALSARVRAAWTAFARGDAPAAPGWPAWEPYREEGRATLRIAAETRRQDDPERERRLLWEGLI